jgi:hypothetical protein
MVGLLIKKMARGKVEKKLGSEQKKAIVLSDSDDPTEKERNGLLPRWVLFIDKYFELQFNASQAYMAVYNVKNADVASACASKLLGYASIDAEIKSRLISQRVTNNAIVEQLWEIAQYRGDKTISAAVAALGILAKASGMLVDSKPPSFTAENPAVFPPPFSAEEMKQMEERRAKMGRIVE